VYSGETDRGALGKVGGSPQAREAREGTSRARHGFSNIVAYMPDPRQVLAEILRRLLYLAKLRNCALAVTLPGGPRDRLRASHLAAKVAVLVDVEDSPWFRRDLTVALRAVSWRSVMVGGVRLWKAMRLR